MTERGRWLRPGLRYAGWISAGAVVITALAVVHERARIAPVIIADNAYVFLAADRLYTGLGLTAPLPRVPTQDWDWQCDWTFLSQWPMGYPLILCAARMLLGTETAQAAGAVSVFCCGVALVGWFALIHRCLPRRIPATLIALLAAASTFSMSNLIDPASDTVLTALIPLVLLLAWSALGWSDETKNPELRTGPRSRPNLRLGRLLLFGVLAGSLVWVRYAAVFVPLGIGAFLVIEWLWSRRVRFGHVAVYALASAVPIVLLVTVNRALSDDTSMSRQYPVGDQLSLDFNPGMFATAWDLFTEQTFYNHRSESKWFFAVAVPVGGLLLPLAWPGSRRSMKRFLANPPVLLCAVLTVTCLIILVVLSTVFSRRFNYVGLDRYYLPIKPFYFLFFVAGVLTFRSPVVRVLACVPLLLACSWTVNQDWSRAYRRLAVRQTEVTPYGRRAVYFEPHSATLYRWLQTQADDNLLILSNFHDDIALETRIPACPTPRSPIQMNEWIERVKRVRKVPDVRVLFVLDPDNHGRRYFLPPPAELVDRFDLIYPAGIPEAIARYVYAPQNVGYSECGGN